MSWSGQGGGRKFAAAGELKALFARVRGQTANSQNGTRAAQILEATVEELQKLTPHDCDIAVETNGHMDPDGTGGALSLWFTFRPHAAPQAPVIADAVPQTPEIVPPTDPAVVGAIGQPAPQAVAPVDGGTSPATDPTAPAVATPDVASEPVAPAPPAEGSGADAVGLATPSIPAPPAP